jgi:hypothetical protein
VVDGEMALDQTQQRHEALAGQPSDNLLLLHHEVSFERTGKTVNLTNPLAQDALLQYCVRAGIEVMFLDNLSCLFRGVAENDADSWELVLPWLLELRRHNIAVVIIHHAGRAGHMRGSSRREDAANWIIRLSEPQDYGAPSTGARFLARFVKNRNCTEESAPPLEWHFVKQGAAQVRVTHRHLDTLAVFRQWVADGLTSASDIAQEMDLSKGMVSRLASAAWRKAGSRRRAASTPWPSLPTSPCPMPMPDPPPARLSVYPLWRINGKRG